MEKWVFSLQKKCGVKLYVESLSEILGGGNFLVLQKPERGKVRGMT